MNLNLSFIPHTRLGATRDDDRELIARFGGKYGSRRPERCTNQKKRRAIVHELSAKPIAPGAIGFAPRKTVIEHRTKHAEHRISPNKHGYF